MSIFYDPKTRKPQPWVIFAFILVPVILVALLFIIGGPMAERTQKAEGSAPKNETDIFSK
jgi:hypothetical protein